MSVHDRKNLKSALESAILYLQKQPDFFDPWICECFHLTT